MIECAQMCKDLEVSCPNKECRQWMDFEEDLNCVRIASHKHGDKTSCRAIRANGSENSTDREGRFG